MAITSDPKLENDPVRRNTSPEMLRQIEHDLEETIRFYRVQPGFVIERRIQELRNEWSMERYLQMNVATLAGLTALLALAKNRTFGLLTCTALTFFLVHGLQGFDPPIALFRRLGIRTRTEIDREMYALKALRGDFENVPAEPAHASDSSVPVQEVVRAVNA